MGIKTFGTISVQSEGIPSSFTVAVVLPAHPMLFSCSSYVPQGDLLNESYMGWKGSQEVIESNSPGQSGLPTRGHTGKCSDGS